MRNSKTHKYLIALLVGLTAPLWTVNHSSAAVDNQTILQSTDASVLSFQKFTPQPSKNTKLNYDYLDHVLQGITFNLGPSDRIRRVDRNRFHNGRQFVTIGHKSPYRLEGSRIYLKRIPGSFAEDIAVYRKELQNLADELPITKLSRNEQLSFWLNLHNVSVLELMSQSRRARHSNDNRFGENKEPMHDVKFIEVDGHKLSLRDIREKIVYPNWDDPNVIYGFYLGDIGSPSLQMSAYKGSTVKSALRENAKEFVNSLRGFEVFQSKAQVSEIYVQASSFYFKNFHEDLRTHFKKNMRDVVFDEVKTFDRFQIAPYAYRIGTINAGRSAGRPRTVVTNSFNPRTFSITSTPQETFEAGGAFQALSRDYVKKREKLREQGLWDSDVIIEDIETEDNN